MPKPIGLCKLNRSPTNLRDLLSSEYTTSMSTNSSFARHVNCNLSPLTACAHFPDLTAAEAKRRAAFGDMRKQLREMQGARFGFRLPTMFCITLPGAKERMFTNPQLALDYVVSTVRNSDDHEDVRPTADLISLMSWCYIGHLLYG